MKYYIQNIFFIAIINICLIYPQSANEIKSELNKAGLSIDDAKKIAKESGILDGPINEQTLQNGKPSFVMARVDDGKNVKDVSILKESFKTNLETVLDFYEQVEEYEQCSKVRDLINKL